MQKATIKKFSILGLVLVAASAVTAAVLPSKAEDKKVDDLFSLTQSEGVSSFSCEATQGDATAPCGGDERSTLGASGSTSQENASDNVTTAA